MHMYFLGMEGLRRAEVPSYLVVWAWAGSGVDERAVESGQWAVGGEGYMRRGTGGWAWH